MPSPSTARHRNSIIRQLSLQNQPSTQPPAGRRALKKQLSEDDGRTRGLDAVEITGQGWLIGGEKPEAGLRATSNVDSHKFNQLKTPPVASRPRQVKLAWADRKPDNAETPTGVEVVARKCQGQPRPLTVKAQRITNLPLLGEKESFVYTRQQLAERLRIAWKEREKNKPNLNIFLAHAAETARSGNEELATVRSNGVQQPDILVHDSVTFRSVSTCDGSDSSVKNSGGVTGDAEKPGGNGIELTEEPANGKDESLRENRQEKTKDGDVNRFVSDCPDFQTFPVTEMPRCGFVSKSNCRNQSDVGCERSKGDANSPRSDSGYSENSKVERQECVGELPRATLETGEENETRFNVTAQERRASFRSGSLLNKAIDESYTPPGANSSEEIEDDFSQDGSREIKVFLRKNEERRPPLTRTFSAPTRNEAQSPKPFPSQAGSRANGGVLKTLPQNTTSIDIPGVDDELNALRGRIKSAPIRRKLRAAATRRKQRGKEPESSDDEKQSTDPSKKRTTRRKATSRSCAGDIVTMVSLVSPATSDAEENAIPLPDETWTAEESEEKTADVEPQKPENDAPKEVSSFIIQKFVSLRKSNKTVSFVQHPPVSRSYSASFPSRRAPAGTPIIVPPPVVTNPALTPAQLQEREKRPQPSSPCIAANADNRGVKRRLIRTASAPQVKDSNRAANDTKTEQGVRDNARSDFSKIEENKEAEDADDENGEAEEKKEPEFKSPKEKECWMLYQKMVEKGVTVSFDTVLRGMLTPTEYRLRRNQLLSSC